MERLFQYFARASASLVLVILLSTVVVLYIYAKPAIDEYGLGFVFDARWGVEVPVEQTASNLAATPAPIPAPAVSESPLDQEQVSSADASDMPDSAELDSSDTEETVVIDDEFGDEFGEDFSEEHFMDDEFTGDEESAGQTRTVYGGAIPIVGSMYSILIAMIFSIPVSMGIAVFLSEIANDKIVKPVSIAIELLAAIPSIIYGMWALFYFGPMVSSWVGGHSVSLLVAGLVLGVMVIPFMAALSRDAINTTPDILKESAYSMGATKTDVIKDIIFPYAKAGIVGSIIVSFGRAIGETMAVAFVIGGIFQFADGLTAPTNSIPVVLANNFAESSGLSMSVLYYLALMLFVVSFVIIFLAKYFLLRRKS